MTLRKGRLRGRLGQMFAALALVAVLATPAWAITTENVIQMHKSGLPPAVIVQTIQSTGSTFNLSVDDLKKLEGAGVPSDVIEAMMASGGGAAPAPAPEPAPEPTDDLEQLRDQEEVEKARIDEEARIHEAGERAAQAERDKMAGEERRRIAGALQGAREALDDREYHKAARLFDDFLKASQPGKPSTLAARLGLADALYGLGLYGNAAEIYHELVNAGAETDVFAPAFVGLRRCAKKVAYNPVTLEAFTNYFPGAQPQGFQDSYNYFLGKFFFDYNRYDEAATYLGKVSDAGDDYADAQYLLGLITVQNAGDDQEAEDFGRQLIGASQYFERAVAGAEASDSPRVAHLAYLALARIAYTVGLFDVGIFYYRKVPSDSTSYVNALHEAGWSYFLKGDVRRGMGIFHTLDGPDWGDYYLPDTHLLEATVFMNKCHFDFAHDALQRIETSYLALRQPLQNFMAEYASPEALYKAFVLKQVRKGIELPHVLRMAVISSSEFYDLYTSVTQLRREVVAIKKGSDRFGADLTKRLLDTVENRHQDSTLALGIKINQLLQGLDDEMNEIEEQVTEIRIEIDEAATTELEKQIEEEYHRDDAVEAAAEAQAAATIFVGDKYVTWPFEGESWSDEINAYRSDLQDVCK